MNRVLTRFWRTSRCWLALLFVPGLAFGSEVPDLVNYQGYVTGPDGGALQDGNFEIEIRLWTHPISCVEGDDARLLWGRRFTAVPVIGGKFNIILGNTVGEALEGAPSPALAEAFATPEVYLGLRLFGVGMSSEQDCDITPRQRILSAPYAVQAGNVEYEPVGAVQMYFGLQAPDGWLFCNGAQIDKETHPEYTRLVDHLRDPQRVGGNAYQGDSTTRAKLPDMRGVFPRGLDQTASRDPEGASRVLGGYQEDSLKAHDHVVRLGQRSDGLADGLIQHSNAPHAPFNWTKTQSTGGAETRPKNLAINFIIKY